LIYVACEWECERACLRLNGSELLTGSTMAVSITSFKKNPKKREGRIISFAFARNFLITIGPGSCSVRSNSWSVAQPLRAWKAILYCLVMLGVDSIGVEGGDGVVLHKLLDVRLELSSVGN
jgi:hypothetical protein